MALLEVASENPDLILLDMMMPVMDGYAVLTRLKTDAATRHIPVVVISAMRELEGVARAIQQGAEDYLPKPFETVLLQARLNASLDRKKLHDLEERYRQALERDLEIGRQIQLTFLPSRLPELPGWELAACFVPARQVSGDLYDAFVLPHSRRVGLVIGDVSDKGVGAALFMALYRSLIRVLTLQLDASNFSDELEQLPQIVMLTNQYVVQTHGEASMFASLFMGLLDPHTGILTYVNAGHNPPLVVSGTGGLTELTRTGAVIGLDSTVTCEARQIQLAHGEMLLAYTDGVTDALSPEGEYFDRPRLDRLLQEKMPSAEATLDQIQSTLREFVAGAPQVDDITLLALRRSENAETKPKSPHI
jgi:serine phosphatase RsbU (regulator of sigma subunit)